MGFVTDIRYMGMVDQHRHLDFICSGAIDFIEYIRFELRLEPTDGFTEIHPSVFYKKIHLPHIGMILIYDSMVLLNYVCNHSDERLQPDLKIYYKCYKYYHHSHEPYGTNHITPMTIEEAMEHIKKEQYDLQIVNEKK